MSRENQKLRLGGYGPVSMFRATEVFTVSPPGFVWDARIRMAPLVGVHVRDSLLDGVGTMHGEVAALVPVVDQTGTPEMAAGTLLRYLAETPWLPTALLPEAGVHWTPIDPQTARATLEHGGTTVSMEVHFGAQGEIARITASRFRDVDGTAVLTPWEGRYFDYVVRDGMRVPGRAEVGWHLEDGWFPYWRGTIERFEDQGLEAEVGEAVASRSHGQLAAAVPELGEAIARLDAGESPAGIASAVEFVLEGLHLNRRLNKERRGGGIRYAR